VGWNKPHIRKKLFREMGGKLDSLIERGNSPIECQNSLIEPWNSLIDYENSLIGL
jgi:hypothetical protein